MVYRSLFLRQLPESVRVMLSRNPPASIADLAKAADDILAAQSPASGIAAVSAGKMGRRAHPSSDKTGTRCFYHAKFGEKARKCGDTSSAATCDMAHLIRNSGNCPRRPLAIKAVSNHHQDGRNMMSVWDRKTGRHYLIDTGADESVFPASPTDRQHCSTTQPLAAANDSRIATCGQRNIIVHPGSRSFTQSFHIADVRQPILGADFLISNNLAIDLCGRRLIHLFSYTIIPTTATLESHKLGIYRVRTDNNDLASILNKFPELLVPRFHASYESLHGVEHCLTITGPPVFSRARRLHDKQLAVAKVEFKMMEDLGIIRRSNSPWSSPLHITPKPGGGWRPCGDFRRLNVATIDDRYPTPHIGDFNGNLQGKIFSLKLTWPEDITKFRWQNQTSEKQPSSLTSAFGNFFTCRLDSRTLLKYFNDSWIPYSVLSPASSSTWMPSWWAAAPEQNMRSISARSSKLCLSVAWWSKDKSVSSASLRSTSSATTLPHQTLNHYQNVSQQFMNSLF